MEHKDIGLGNIHGIVNFTFTTRAAMLAQAVSSADLYKTAFVAEDQKLYILYPLGSAARVWRPLNISKETTTQLVFEWHPNSDTTTGQSVDDFGAYGTGTYSPIDDSANTSNVALRGMSSHLFTSATNTYSGAGVASANAVIRMPDATSKDTFVFEATVKQRYQPGTTRVFGLLTARGQAVGNFSGTDKGVGFGWNTSSAASAGVMRMAGNGSTVVTGATGVPLDTTPTLHMTLRIGYSEEFGVFGAEHIIRTMEDPTGSKITAFSPASALPPVGTAMYCVTAVGTADKTTPVGLNLVNVKFTRRIPIE